MRFSGVKAFMTIIHRATFTPSCPAHRPAAAASADKRARFLRVIARCARRQRNKTYFQKAARKGYPFLFLSYTRSNLNYRRNVPLRLRLSLVRFFRVASVNYYNSA